MMDSITPTRDWLESNHPFVTALVTWVSLAKWWMSGITRVFRPFAAVHPPTTL